MRGMPTNGPYDEVIQIEVSKYLPEWYDWRLFKAQMYQESLFDPHARSPVGALGVAQFMPGTWRDMVRALRIPEGIEPTNPQWAIRAAAYYMATLRRQWSSSRTEMDRTMLAMASYNAGFGNLIKAQREARGARPYGDIMAQLHLVTGTKNAQQTRTYVKRILEYWTGSILRTSA